ncbi:hypothetical protein QTP86_011961 [Hemibagrus guttatus]|nr:hypothetical protein QTP86_011961 [Hemibagrus guttatus]
MAVVVNPGLDRSDGAIPKPGSEAAAQDALDGPSVEHGQDGGREMGFSQPPQEVEELLGFLADVELVLSDQYKRHLSTTSNSQTPNSTMAKTKELSKDTRKKIVDLHQAGKTESAIVCGILWQGSRKECRTGFAEQQQSAATSRPKVKRLNLPKEEVKIICIS